MPNVTVFLPADKMPDDDRLQRFTAACTDLCTGILKASLANVHIIFVPVRHGRGHPAYVEIKFRLETFRPPDVMQAFMEALDETLLAHVGLTGRIRCFGYAATDIFARN